MLHSELRPFLVALLSCLTVRSSLFVLAVPLPPLLAAGAPSRFPGHVTPRPARPVHSAIFPAAQPRRPSVQLRAGSAAASSLEPAEAERLQRIAGRLLVCLQNAAAAPSAEAADRLLQEVAQFEWTGRVSEAQRDTVFAFLLQAGGLAATAACIRAHPNMVTGQQLCLGVLASMAAPLGADPRLWPLRGRAGQELLVDVVGATILAMEATRREPIVQGFGLVVLANVCRFEPSAQLSEIVSGGIPRLPPDLYTAVVSCVVATLEAHPRQLSAHDLLGLIRDALRHGPSGWATGFLLSEAGDRPGTTMAARLVALAVQHVRSSDTPQPLGERQSVAILFMGTVTTGGEAVPSTIDNVEGARRELLRQIAGVPGVIELLAEAPAAEVAFDERGLAAFVLQLLLRCHFPPGEKAPRDLLSPEAWADLGGAQLDLPRDGSPGRGSEPSAGAAETARLLTRAVAASARQSSPPGGNAAAALEAGAVCLRALRAGAVDSVLAAIRSPRLAELLLLASDSMTPAKLFAFWMYAMLKKIGSHSSVSAVLRVRLHPRTRLAPQFCCSRLVGSTGDYPAPELRTQVSDSSTPLSAHA